jgi:integrase
MSRLRGTRWQADALIRGERKRKSFLTRAEADAWAAKHTPKAETSDPVDNQGETLLAFAKRLQRQLWGTGDQSVAAMRHVNEAVAIINDIAVRDFRTTHVHLLTAAYQAAGNQDSTINRKYASLSKLCKCAVETELLVKMPLFKRKEEPEGRKRYLTLGETTKLFAALRLLGEPDHDLAIFLVDTGCRCGEAHDLLWKWVNFDAVSIHPVTRKKTLGSITFTKTKAQLTRTVPMTTRVRTMLLAKRDNPTPFSDINPWTFRTHWDKVRAADEDFKDDEDFVPHVLRHTCASRLVQGGVPLFHVQRWLGHRSASMTDRYSHLAPDSLTMGVSTLEAYA